MLPKLLLLHGWGCASTVWDPFLPFLKSVSVEVFEYEQAKTLGDLVAQLHLTIEAPTHLLGWSLGGLVATQYALQYPECVLSLATVASSPCFQRQADWPGLEASTLLSFEKLLDSEPSRARARFATLQLMHGPEPKKWLPILLAGDCLFELFSIIKEGDCRDQLGALQCPTLHIVGECDPIVPQTWHSKVIAGASHVPFLTHPKRVAELIIDFVHNETRLEPI